MQATESERENGQRMRGMQEKKIPNERIRINILHFECHGTERCFYYYIIRPNAECANRWPGTIDGTKCSATRNDTEWKEGMRQSFWATINNVRKTWSSRNNSKQMMRPSCHLSRPVRMHEHDARLSSSRACMAWAAEHEKLVRRASNKLNCHKIHSLWKNEKSPKAKRFVVCVPRQMFGVGANENTRIIANIHAWHGSANKMPSNFGAFKVDCFCFGFSVKWKWIVPARRLIARRPGVWVSTVFQFLVHCKQKTLNWIRFSVSLVRCQHKINHHKFRMQNLWGEKTKCKKIVMFFATKATSLWIEMKVNIALSMPCCYSKLHDALHWAFATLRAAERCGTTLHTSFPMWNKSVGKNCFPSFGVRWSIGVRARPHRLSTSCHAFSNGNKAVAAAWRSARLMLCIHDSPQWKSVNAA